MCQLGSAPRIIVHQVLPFLAIWLHAVVATYGGAQRPPARKGSMKVVEDIQRRVALAGGNTHGVLVASLAWATPDDLDLHVVVPGGAEINYRSRTFAGGMLDVDMCVHGRRGSKSCTERPVENIVFADVAPAGRYEVYVQNFNFHPNYIAEDLQVARMHEGRNKASKEEQRLRLGRDRPVLFEVLVKVEGSYKLFRGLCTVEGKTKEESNVKIFDFDYMPSAKSEDRLVSKYEASNNSVCSEFQQKLLAGTDGRKLSGGRHSLDAGHRDAGSVRTHTQPRRQTPSGTSRRARAANEKKQEVLIALRRSSRETLLSKPSKLLQELLSDLGISCRSCVEKGELVERLLREAGVSQRSEDL